MTADAATPVARIHDTEYKVMRFVQRQLRRNREPEAQWEQPWPLSRPATVQADLEDIEEALREAAD